MALPGLSELNAQAASLAGRIKPSERRLLILLALAALAGLAFEAFDMVEKAQSRNSDAQTALARIHQTLRRGQGGVANRVAGEAADVRAWSWQADNADVGKVMVQNDIATMADKAGLLEADVKAGDKLQPAGDVKLVSIELTAPYTWQGLSDFFAALDASGKGFVIDQVQMPDDEKPRLKIDLRAPLILNPPPPHGAAHAPAKPAKTAKP